MADKSPTPPLSPRPVPKADTTQAEDRTDVLEGERLARAQARVGQAVRGSHENS
ncbi:hypothetical protein [Brevundimonas goettingensis]|uniref:Uncharacterized protein n=1 Tax=Brevundimonas goettingensis TaxID=2774190 RepID=A0A975C1U2_9CAUL|nr:hypothetical protein [Brevundimonas goettingensis]QTC90255.1 hypothetical protein IFJ75_13320 [Brevundimonas goettingensis]